MFDSIPWFIAIPQKHKKAISGLIAVAPAAFPGDEGELYYHLLLS